MRHEPEFWPDTAGQHVYTYVWGAKIIFIRLEPDHCLALSGTHSLTAVYLTCDAAEKDALQKVMGIVPDAENDIEESIDNN